MAKEIPFPRVLNALLDGSTALHPRYLNRLSDLDPENLARLAEVWEQISPRRRNSIMEDLFEIAESDLLLNFEGVCSLALKDPLPNVRSLAIRILHEYELQAYLPDFLRMAQQDPDENVQATAITALGLFVYLGEVEELAPERLHSLEEYLLGILNSSDEPRLRQRALETLGYSSRPEVNPLIETAYRSEDPAWLAASLNAMGRSANQRWKTHILAHLNHLRPMVRAEAASAAGELEIASARGPLLKLLEDHDIDVRMAAIWALSQIGGKGVLERLEHALLNAESDDEEELIDSAIENLAMSDGSLGFSLMTLDETDLEDEEALGIEQDLDGEEDDDLGSLLDDEEDEEIDDGDEDLD